MARSSVSLNIIVPCVLKGETESLLERSLDRSDSTRSIIDLDVASAPRESSVRLLSSDGQFDLVGDLFETLDRHAVEDEGVAVIDR